MAVIMKRSGDGTSGPRRSAQATVLAALVLLVAACTGGGHGTVQASSAAEAKAKAAELA